jgi:hypothetical protein
MLIERKALVATTAIAARARPAACLDCPDCRGTCWEAVALRLVPDSVLHAREPRA